MTDCAATLPAGHFVLFENSGYPIYRLTQGRQKSVAAFEMPRLSIPRNDVK